MQHTLYSLHVHVTHFCRLFVAVFSCRAQILSGSLFQLELWLSGQKWSHIPYWDCPSPTVVTVTFEDFVLAHQEFDNITNSYMASYRSRWIVKYNLRCHLNFYCKFNHLYMLNYISTYNQISILSIINIDTRIYLSKITCAGIIEILQM